MPDLDPQVRVHAQAALDDLDSVHSDGSSLTTKRCLDSAMRQLIAARGALIAAHNEGWSSDGLLARTNAILSSLFGTEFPKDGLQWKRVCESREALRDLLKTP